MKLRALFLFFVLTLVVPAVAAAQTSSTGVSKAPPPTCTIIASSGAVYLGDSVNLRWASQNATGGTITSLGTVGPSGIQGVIPTAYSNTFVGTFTGPGGTGTCSVTVGILQGSPAGGGAPAPVATPSAPPTDTGIVTGSGLIPCDGINCQACHLASLAQRIINWLVGISIPLAAAMFAYAGIIYFSSGIEGGWNEKGKAHNIFKSVGIGFLIVLCAWLGIQTVLKTVLSPGFYQNWNEIKCVDDSKRPKTSTIQQMLSIIPFLRTDVSATTPTTYGGSTGFSCDPGYELIGTICRHPDSGDTYSAVSSQQTFGGASCDPGYQLVGNACVNPDNSEDSYLIVPPAPIQTGVGDCSVGALQDDFADDASVMSCIAKYESNCNPISAGDKTRSGTPVSIGTYQINMTVHKVQCDEYNNGAPVNCPAAFSGRYTGSNKDIQVVNQELYTQCRNMLTNPDCNSQVAQGVLNTQGHTAWTTYGKYCGG